MRAGELDRPIVIQSKSVTPDSFGTPVETWTKIHTSTTIPAKVSPARGGERFAADQVVGKAMTTFRVRYRDGVTVLHRIVYAGRNWDIHDVRELGRREGLEIDASARSES
jgi:SPP1 family predicted phage head-tail adaptor